jgi:hypothetical protein
MNLVASAILRGMVGASSSADLSGVPGNKRAKARGDAAASDRATGYAEDSLHTALDGGEDARTALKGTQAQAGLREKSQGHGNEGWHLFRSKQSGADAVQISEAGRSAPGTSGAQTAAQDGTNPNSTGTKLSIKA